MTWVRTEDNMPLHQKMLRLSDGAFRLWCNALHFANRGVTDGRIDKGLIPSMNHHGRWSPRQLSGFISELVPGLWIDRGDHYEIHDYAHHQAEAMKDRVERKRELDRIRQQRKRDKDEDAQRESLGLSRRDGERDDRGDNTREISVPSRPVPSASDEAVSSARDVVADFVESNRAITSEELRAQDDVVVTFSAAWKRETGVFPGLNPKRERERSKSVLAWAREQNRENPLVAVDRAAVAAAKDLGCRDAGKPWAMFASSPGTYFAKASTAPNPADRLPEMLARQKALGAAFRAANDWAERCPIDEREEAARRQEDARNAKVAVDREIRALEAERDRGRA